MGRFDVSLLKYTSAEEFRILTAVELGMRNHDVVPHKLVAVIANLRYGGAHKVLRELAKNRLVAYETCRSVQGYRLTNLGYDFLALRSLASRGAVQSVGNQIGVGKESDIYLALDGEGEECVLKFHRLGRTSFRKVKEKRDYQKNGRSVNWIYLSRLAAVKEFAFMSALHKHKFPVPAPIDTCRHVVVMQLCPGYVLNQINQLGHPAKVFTDLMNVLIKLASVGLIHGDFNEFNIMISDDEEVKIIDFPQMISTSHYNAETLFNRDRNCIETFFKRRFDFEALEALPTLKEIEKRTNLDADVAASGYTAELREECDTFLDPVEKEKDESEDQKEDQTSNQSSSDESEQNSDISEEKDSDKQNESDSQKPVSESSPDASNLNEKDKKPRQSQLIDIEVEGKGDSQKLLEDELTQNFENLYTEPTNEQRDLMARLRLDSHTSSLGGRNTAISSSYVSTTIPPDVIRQRLKKQKAKQNLKEKCHRAVKQGEASLKTRRKDDVRDTIKSSCSAVWS